MKRIVCSIIILLGCSILEGCTPPNVPLTDSFWQNSQQKMTVATVVPPTPGMYKKGPQGVVDMMISYAADEDFTNYISKTDLTWYGNFKADFIKELQKRNMQASIYPDNIPIKQKDYSSIFAQTNSNNLLLIRLEALGAVREYYGFIPLDAPKGYCVLSGELINLQNNQVLWRDRVELSQPVSGKWDQPQHYPNFSDALNAVEYSAQQKLLDNFFIGH